MICAKGKDRSKCVPLPPRTNLESVLVQKKPLQQAVMQKLEGAVAQASDRAGGRHRSGTLMDIYTEGGIKTKRQRRHKDERTSMHSLGTFAQLPYATLHTCACAPDSVSCSPVVDMYGHVRAGVVLLRCYVGRLAPVSTIHMQDHVFIGLQIASSSCHVPLLVCTACLHSFHRDGHVPSQHCST